MGVAVSVLCLWLAFRNEPVAGLARLIGGAHALWLLPTLAWQLLAVAARAQRWLVLLERKEGFANSFWAQSVGFLFTNLFPMRLGEPARVLVMSERCGLPIMQVAASAILEGLLDVAANVLVFVLVLPWMRVPPLMVRAGVSFGLLLLMGLGIVLLAVRFGPRSERLLWYICTRLPLLPTERVVRYWGEIVSGFLPLTRGRIVLQAAGLSVVMWSSSIAVYWSVLRAFQPDARVVEAASLMAALSFAVAIPSSPGFVGVFQLARQQALVVPFGARYGSSIALAITITAHPTYYLPTTLLGVLGLWRLGKSFANLGRTLELGRSRRKAPLAEAGFVP